MFQLWFLPGPIYEYAKWFHLFISELEFERCYRSVTIIILSWLYKANEIDFWWNFSCIMHQTTCQFWVMWLAKRQLASIFTDIHLTLNIPRHLPSLRSWHPARPLTLAMISNNWVNQLLHFDPLNSEKSSIPYIPLTIGVFTCRHIISIYPVVDHHDLLSPFQQFVQHWIHVLVICAGVLVLKFNFWMWVVLY